MRLTILKIFLSILFFSTFSHQSFAQKGKEEKEAIEDSLSRLVVVDDTVRYQKLPYDTVTFDPGDVIELEQADEMIGYKDSLIKVVGNVIFTQGNVKVYCDSAYKFPDNNNLEAFGHVRFIQDSLTMNCDRIFYNGDMRLLQARSNVRATDPKMSLTTDFLDYSLNSKIGYYFGGGTVVDSKNTLSSQSGSYDTQSRHYYFRDNVKVNGRNKSSTYNITSSILQYNSYSKVVFFNGPTHIKTPNGKIFANSGTYNTLNQVSNFSGRSMVENEQYILRGDYLHYQERRVYGIAKGNAEIFIKKDSILINGDKGRFFGTRGITRVYGNAHMRNINNGDTLFLSADTLVSYNKRVRPGGGIVKLDSAALTKEKRALVAYHKVKIFRKDMQGMCDSLLYDIKDSTIHLFNDPILWHDNNQMTSDSIRVLMTNNEIDHVEMRQNSFVISQDTVLNHNQMKGRTMDVYFKDQEIDLLDVKGNAETIYFILEEDNSLKGMSKSISSNIKAFFEDNDISKMGYYKDVDGKVIPPNELQGSEKKLSGYNWREKERPTRKTVLLRNKRAKEVDKKDKNIQKKKDQKKVVKDAENKKKNADLKNKNKKNNSKDKKPKKDQISSEDINNPKDVKESKLDKLDKANNPSGTNPKKVPTDNKEPTHEHDKKLSLSKDEKKAYRAKKKKLRMLARSNRRLQRMIRESEKEPKKKK